MPDPIRQMESGPSPSDPVSLNRPPDLLARVGRTSMVCWWDSDGEAELIGFNHFGRQLPDPFGTAKRNFDRWSMIIVDRNIISDMFLTNNSILMSRLIISHLFREVSRIVDNDHFEPFQQDYSTNWGLAMVPLRSGAAQVHEVKIDGVMAHLHRTFGLQDQPVINALPDPLPQEVMDSLSAAILVVDRTGNVVRLNASAEETLGGNEGLKLRNGVLTFADVRLMTAVRAATTSKASMATAVRIDRGAERAAQYVNVVPLRDGLALVVYRNLELERSDPAQSLRTLFSLTRSETSVALDIADGLAITSIAEKRGVSPGTVKSQVKSIASKMACGSQVEIAATVARLGLARNWA